MSDNHHTLQELKDIEHDEEVIEGWNRTYRCPKCGYKQTFDEAYMDNGKYCPACDAELNIPLEYWER